MTIPFFHSAVNLLLATKNIPVVSQPTYSRSSSPCNFSLVLRTKIVLKGQNFGTLENIKMFVTDRLKAIPVFVFQNCYERWKHRLCGISRQLLGKETMIKSNFNSIEKL